MSERSFYAALFKYILRCRLASIKSRLVLLNSVSKKSCKSASEHREKLSEREVKLKTKNLFNFNFYGHILEVGIKFSVKDIQRQRWEENKILCNFWPFRYQDHGELNAKHCTEISNWKHKIVGKFLWRNCHAMNEQPTKLFFT